MKKSLILTLSISIGLFLLSSCSVKKYCQDHYPPIQSDSVTTVISYECEHDTIQIPYAELAFDTTFLPTSIIFHEEEKKDHLSASVDIKGGKLTFKCAEDSLKQVIDGLKKVITVSDHRTNTVVKEVYKEHWYVTPLIWLFIVFLLENIIIVLLKYFKLTTKI